MPPAPRKRLRPLPTQSVAQLAYSAIRESILEGRFAMGERIVETRVADELGISRAPIREALRRLAEERLVVERPRHGSFVREVTAADFISIYNVRIAIETAAMRLVTRKQPSLDAVERTIDDMAKAAASNRVQKVADLELAVHQQICDASENDYLASVFRSLAGPIRMALGLDDAGYERIEDIVTEHYPLLEAIRSGNEDKAARAIELHIVSSVGPVLERLGGSTDDLLTRA